MINRFMKLNNYKNFRPDYILLFGLIVLAIPLIISCNYIQPSADDFIYASWAKTSQQTNYWQYQIWNYLSWNGRYFSTILLTFNPLVFQSFAGYKLIPIFILLVFYTGLFSFLKSLTNEKNIRIHIFSLMLSICYFNMVPSLPETLYWMSGAVTYTLTWGFLFYWGSFLIKYYKNEHHKSINAFFIFLLTFIIIGSNELSAFITLTASCVLFVFRILSKRKLELFTLLLLIFSGALLVLVFLAPGNKARLMQFDNHYNLQYALVSTLKNSIKIFVFHIKNPALIVLVILVWLNISKNTFFNFTKEQTYNRSLYFIAAVMFIIIPIGYFSSAFNMGIEPPLRVHGFMGIIVIFILLYFSVMIRLNQSKLSISTHLIKKLNILLSIAFFVFVLGSFHRKAGEAVYFTGNITQALYDVSKNATLYNMAHQKRHKLIESEKCKGNLHISVPAIQFKPPSIYFVDIKADSTHWINWGTAHFFNIKSIRLTE